MRTLTVGAKMNAGVVALLFFVPGASAAQTQNPCVPEVQPRAALARVNVEHAPSGPLPEQANASVNIQAVVGDGIVDTFAPAAIEEKLRAGQPVAMCGEDRSPVTVVAEITNATIRVASRTCDGVIARAVLEGQVVLRSPDGRRLRGASARRKPLYAEAPGGLFLSPLTSAEPSPDIARALAAVARRLARDPRVVGWGVSDRSGSAVVHILHTERLLPSERFTDVGGIPAVWSALPAGAFERAGCSAVEVPGVR